MRTRPHPLFLPVVAAAFSAHFALPALAQPGKADPDPKSSPPALAGPRVGASIQTGKPTPSLIQREFDGRLMRLESEPVSAAVRIMDLSTGERAKVDKVLLERSVAIDRLLQDNIRLVLEAQNAFKPGDNGSGQLAIASLFEQAKPIFLKGKLIDLAAAALPEDKARQLREIVDEYTQAGMQDRIARGEQKNRFGAFVAENAANFQKEVEASAKRVFEGGEKEFAELSKALDLTSEQQGKIQTMYLDMVAKAKGKPSQQQGLKVILEAMQILTPEQKQKLRQIVAQEARDAGQRKAAEKKALQPGK